jgi:hypothetical protein
MSCKNIPLGGLSRNQDNTLSETALYIISNILNRKDDTLDILMSLPYQRIIQGDILVKLYTNCNDNLDTMCNLIKSYDNDEITLDDIWYIISPRI